MLRRKLDTAGALITHSISSTKLPTCSGFTPEQVFFGIRACREIQAWLGKKLAWNKSLPGVPALVKNTI